MIEEQQLSQELNADLNTMLREFIVTFGASLDPRFWLTLIEEETKELEYEFLTARSREKGLKELTDVAYVTIGFNIVSAGAQQLGLFPEEELKHIQDSILAKAQKYYRDTIEYLGPKLDGGQIDLFEAFRRVHLSNMSKLGEDGKPIRREDGKILKGPFYKEPDLKDLV